MGTFEKKIKVYGPSFSNLSESTSPSPCAVPGLPTYRLNLLKNLTSGLVFRQDQNLGRNLELKKIKDCSLIFDLKLVFCMHFGPCTKVESRRNLFIVSLRCRGDYLSRTVQFSFHIVCHGVPWLYASDEFAGQLGSICAQFGGLGSAGRTARLN